MSATRGARGGAGSSSKTPPDPPYLVGAVDHALRIVEAIDQRGEIRVYEAAELLGVARSSAHRLLTTLRHRGFVAQDPDSPVYRLGPVLVAIALRAYDGMDLRRLSRPHLERLRDDIDETFHLLVLEGENVRFLEGAEGSQMLRVALQIGKVLPATDTAGGKAILAAMDEIGTLPAGHMTSPLKDALKETHERGYARHFRKGTGVIGVAVAIRNTLKAPIAAVAMAAPKDRMPESRVIDIAGKLDETARVIETEIKMFRKHSSTHAG